ncbi:hypothetical protein KZ686_15960 [Cupriavidus cauae]|uniref:GNAT family N-acetyltransferase n=1 Tax=Cupriavidus cauae TaxID=2608999 RepID=A0A5M8AHE0_9BURK|nr:hypothetical protein [Cupriavidus cauae]KAA6123118.1 hypothetical protein F1599_14650 [Cupriavidus cauae]UZN51666.1 hypothetical protein KZ686_15960 [Cupriavidus cauae]
MLTLTLEADWSAAKAEAFNVLCERFPTGFTSQDEFDSAVAEYNLVDLHWNWLNKAHHAATNDYQWFYLMAEDKVQGVCIIFHPKPSREDGEKIFYIDYIAAAYWNRNRPGYKRRFSNIGHILITYAVDHAVRVLGYRPGFSLHALPTAESYYSRLGMTPYDCDANKEGLRYFEASEVCARAVLERAYA